MQEMTSHSHNNRGYNLPSTESNVKPVFITAPLQLITGHLSSDTI